MVPIAHHAADAHTLEAPPRILIGGSLYQQAPPRVQGPEGESLKRPGSHTEESEEELEPVPGSRR